MKRYKVNLSRETYKQLDSLEQWIEQEAGGAIARRYRQAIVAHCRTLADYPYRGRRRDDVKAGMRSIVFRGSVTIGYVVVGDMVQIVAIAGRGRDIQRAMQDLDQKEE